MATTELTDEALLAILDTHPHLRDRIASIVGVVENSDGNLEEADAIEERVTEELRLLGLEVIQGWAEGQVEATERDIRQHPQMHRQGKKTPLADEIRRNRGLMLALRINRRNGDWEAYWAKAGNDATPAANQNRPAVRIRSRAAPVGAAASGSARGFR